MNKSLPSLRVKEKVMVTQKKLVVRMQKVKVKVRVARLPLVRTNLRPHSANVVCSCSQSFSRQLNKMNLNHLHVYSKT